jgi:hypothetical protein
MHLSEEGQFHAVTMLRYFQPIDAIVPFNTFKRCQWIRLFFSVYATAS